MLLDIATFFNLNKLIQVGGKTYPIIARIVEELHCPLVQGKPFRDGHAEDPAVLNNQPKNIFHVGGGQKEKKVIYLTSKALRKLLGNHKQLSAEGTRLKIMTRKLSIRIGAAIQECTHCTN